MCGIAGIMMKRGAPLAPEILGRMQAALAHRGPDGQGRYLRPGVGLAQTRLAIVDLATGDQPLFGPGGVALIANAEMYNSPELRAEYPHYPFRTGSDCEAVLPLFERYGEAFAAHLRGMYAVALYEPASGRLFLARDPFGIKPLYYAETEGFFAFASEPEGLLRAGLAPPELDPARRSELLQLKFTTGSDTIFSGIKRVLPGETLVLKAGEVVSRRHAPSLPAGTGRKPPDMTHAAALAGFERVMFDTVEAHLRMDTPWRLFLSGGIDSTLLMTVARRVSTKPVEALTVGYEGGGATDESAEALRIAEASGVACRRVEMTAADFWALAPRIAAALDDPCTDPAVLPTYMLAAATRDAGAKVALCGEGADELFGGYRRYRRALLPVFLRRRIARRGAFSGTAGAVERLHGWDAGINMVERREAASRHSRLAALQSIDTLEWLPNDLLIKLDRCLMAVGIEGRTPFLDPAVLRFAHGLPDRFKVRLGLGKVLMRDWLAAANPAARPYAKKKGFNVPVGRWMGQRRVELARLVGAQPGAAAVFGPDVIASAFAAAATRPQPAWSLLFYALWHSHHVLGIDCMGDVAAVLGAAAERGPSRAAA